MTIELVEWRTSPLFTQRQRLVYLSIMDCRAGRGWLFTMLIHPYLADFITLTPRPAPDGVSDLPWQ